MALRKVIHEGDPILRKQSREIAEITNRIKALVDDMWETMYDANGIGLAAPQVGVLRRLIVIDISEVLKDEEETGEEAHGVDIAGANEKAEAGLSKAAKECAISEDHVGLEKAPEIKKYLMVNPEIIEVSEETVAAQEGCLSVPGMLGVVTRPAQVKVRALDIEGNPFEVVGEGLLAKALQHEIDHLDGKLYIDIADTVEEISSE